MPPAQETLNDVRIAYGEDLAKNQNYEKATEIFKTCEVNETLQSTLDEISNH